MITKLTRGILMLIVSVQSVVVDITAGQVADAIPVPTVNANTVLPMTNDICYNKTAGHYVDYNPKRF